jgi:2-keto-4-pentenoate hydratase/2-oxohepta-3-ene-1,7-dioic acid hydratase in catechol pathway
VPVIGRFKKGDKVFFGTVDGDTIKSDSSEYKLSELRILPPTVPTKIICIGLNYIDHANELNYPIPQWPILFIKPSTTVIGHTENIEYPTMSSRVEYEGEMAIIISEKCKNVKDPEAVILGYTCINDVTARDIQRKDVQWTRAKSFDTFAPIGPFITSDIDPGNARIETRVNGKTRQKSNTKNLIFDVNDLVRFISEVMTLNAGDVIATGTPYGVGELSIGDTVEIELEGAGVLSNNVIRGQ